VDNSTFRLLKVGTPGAYTFILEATKDVPSRLSHPQRKTIGLRVPNHPVTQALLQELGEPILSTTLIPAGETNAMNDADEIALRYEHQIQAVLDAGACSSEASTVIDLSGDEPVLLRKGLGDPAALGLYVND
ncbi:MAG: L-threonylcarbamoyladenylate synthase, partial [Saezia sp.]